jgi:hypothetical protein
MVSDSVLDEPGAVIDLRESQINPRDRVAAYRLLMELRCVCRSATKGGLGGYTLQPDTAWWLRLRDVEPLVLTVKVMVVEREHPGWRLPGDPAQPVHARIESYFSERRR